MYPLFAAAEFKCSLCEVLFCAVVSCNLTQKKNILYDQNSDGDIPLSHFMESKTSLVEIKFLLHKFRHD